MKKLLIALATLVASSVFAQSNVTIYGIVDQGYGTLSTTNASGDKTTVKGISSQQSTSRIGFKGQENIGGGLKANVVLEYYIEPDNGSGIGAGTNGASTARQAFVGLEGSAGSVNIGTQFTLMALTHAVFDVNGQTNTVGFAPGMNQNTRRTNMITYATPTVAGFNAAVQMGYAGANDATTGNNRAVRVSYTNGPLVATAGKEITTLTKMSIQAPGTTLPADFSNATGRTLTDLSDALGDRRRTAYGASYDFGKFKAVVGRSEANAGSSADRGEFKTTTVGASIPVGKAWTVNISTDRGEWVDSGAAAKKFNAYQVGGLYALSKRTDLYVLAGGIEVKDSALKDKQITAGIRHNF